MTPNDLQQWRHRLNLSQAAAGALLGVGAQTVYRWEAGTRRISAMAAKFMECLEEMESVREQYGDEWMRADKGAGLV